MILIIKRAILFLIMFLVFGLSFLPMLGDSLIIVLSTLLSLLVLTIEKQPIKLFFKTYYLPILFFFILLLGLLYTKDIDRGIGQIEKNLSFIALPICIFSIRNLINTDKLIAYFSYGVVLTASFCDLYQKIDYGSFFTYGYSILLSPVDLDPTYFSMYAIIAMSYFLIRLISKGNTVLYSILILYLLFFYFRVGSKVGLLMLFVVIGIFGVYYLKKQPKKVIIIAFFFFAGCVLISYFTPLFYNRFYAPLFENNLDFYQLRLKFFNERYYTWKCSIESINLKSIWLGYGTGDDANILKTCYRNYNKDYNLNPHSIYFSSILKNGLLGLCALLFLIFQGFRLKNVLFSIFSLSILFIGLSESLLERQKGIIFFALICTLILTDILKKRENRCAEL